MNQEEVVLTAMALIVLSGVSVLWLAMVNRRKLREMEHRERLAMIERGLMPPPELDPAGFEHKGGWVAEAGPPAARRSESLGIMLIGVGIGLLVLLSFAAGAPGAGAGVGGAFAVLGAAFLFNGMMLRRREPLGPTPRPGRPVASAVDQTPPHVGP